VVSCWTYLLFEKRRGNRNELAIKEKEEGREKM